MWNLYRIPWNPYEICGIHVKYVESMWNTMESIWNMWNPYGILWNPCGIHVEYYRIHIEYVESIWNTMESMWNMCPYGFHGRNCGGFHPIPPGFQRNIPWNI